MSSAKIAGMDERVKTETTLAKVMKRPELGAMAGLVLVLIFFLITADGAMFTLSGVMNFMSPAAQLGLLAIGAALLMIGGEFDLSIGSMVAFAGMIFGALVVHLGLPLVVSVPATLVFAGLIGAANGWVVLRTGLPSFIVTLAGMFLARGAASVLSPDSIAIRHDFYSAVSKTYLMLPGGGRISVIGGLMILVFVLGSILAHRTRFGAAVYALGGNATSAALMGVPVARTTILIYMLSSSLAGLAGIVFSLYTKAGYSLSAVGVELDAIAAVVIGGTLLTGGYGFVAGTFIGVMLQGLVQTYIVFDGSLSSWWTKIVIGALLFMFILLQRLVFSASAPTRKASWKA